MSYHRANQRFLDVSVLRLKFIVGLILLFGVGIIFRLFFLQIIEHNDFTALAKRQHVSGITIPARRGEILTRDMHTGNFFKLATNITLDLLYVDPLETVDKRHTAKALAPFVFSREDYEACIEDEILCPDYSEKKSIASSIQDAVDPEASDEEDNKYKVKSYDHYVEYIQEDIEKRISRSEVTYSVLKSNVKTDTLKKVSELHISGVEVDEDRKVISADPTQISEKDAPRIARVLDPILNVQYKILERKMERKYIRYVPLKRQLSPEASDEISKLKKASWKESQKTEDGEDLLKGVVLLPEHWRYYPNEYLSSQLLGFYSNEFGGQYGLEEAFDSDLVGKQGKILADTDPTGNAISFGEQDIENVINGKSIVLTLVPPIQKKVEEILERNVKTFNAVSAQVIIMDPFTGAIIAMANYPTFNPNNYGEVFEKEKAKKWEEIPHYIDVFIKDEEGYRAADDDERNNYDLDRYIYKNIIGPKAYRNKCIQDIYEPGSVFKPIAMAIALDRNEVSPQSKYLDTGVVKTGEYLGTKEIEIGNANGKVYGWVTMTECLEESINTCMAYVAGKLGKDFYAPLFHDYIKDFGFGEYTDIELNNEEKGKVVHHLKWTKTQLMTTSFGQGIAATPLQVVSAWAALANGGDLVKPYLIESIIDSNGNVEKTDKVTVQKAISKETSSTITAMLVSAVENGVAHPAKVKGHLLAGKTGTSQIAKERGVGYERGEGANITSFIGYAPVHHPKFVMLVKFDRPRYGSDNTWGSTTAAPTFREIAEFLFKYYNISPDDE